MSYRRQSEHSKGWNEWLAANRAELAATGVPHGIYEHERYWLYFLEHAAFPGEDGVPRFDIADLTTTESRHLLQLLHASAQIPDSIALRILERTCSDTDVA